MNDKELLARLERESLPSAVLEHREPVVDVHDPEQLSAEGWKPT